MEVNLKKIYWVLYVRLRIYLHTKVICIGTIILVHYSRRKKWFSDHSSFEKNKLRFLFCLATYKLTYFDFPEIILTLQGSFNYWENKGQVSGLIKLGLPFFVVVVKWDNMHSCGGPCRLERFFNSLSLSRAAREKRK